VTSTLSAPWCLGYWLRAHLDSTPEERLAALCTLPPEILLDWMYRWLTERGRPGSYWEAMSTLVQAEYETLTAYLDRQEAPTP
jgi:hypothetical protein